MLNSNPEMFDLFAGAVFAKLYESFPSPISLLPGAFIDGGPDAVFDETGFTSKEAQLFIDTVFWLLQEGYVQARDPSRANRGLYMATLTEKGLAVLRFTPDSLKEKITLGERLASSAKSGAKEALKIAAKEALGVVVKIVSHS